MSRGVVLFHSIHAVLQLEKGLKARGVESESIPTPRHLSSDCGMALSFAACDAERVRAAISELNLEVQGIHDLEA
jgi:Putative Se/S carrier protein-like